jgi:hypothetical protein
VFPSFDDRGTLNVGGTGRRGHLGAAGRDLRIRRQLQGHAHGLPAPISGSNRPGGQAGAARLGGDAEKKNPAEAGLDFAAFGIFRTAFGLMVRRPDRLDDHPFTSARVGL